MCFFSRLLPPFADVAYCIPATWAHEARPAYLEIKETAPGQYSMLWRTPVLAGMRLPIALKLPDDVNNLREPSIEELADSLVERRWVNAGQNSSLDCKPPSLTLSCV